MPITIRIAITSDKDEQLLQRIMGILLPFDDFFHFERISVPAVIPHRDEIFAWEDFQDACVAMRLGQPWNPTDFLVVLTPYRNRGNWFSASMIHLRRYTSLPEEYFRNIFIQSSGWDYYFTDTDPAYPLAYEVIANIWHHWICMDTQKTIWHNEPKGCINDMCGWKPDIALKMRTGHICGECLEEMRRIVAQQGFNATHALSATTRILEALRPYMRYVNRSTELLNDEQFLALRIAKSRIAQHKPLVRQMTPLHAAIPRPAPSLELYHSSSRLSKLSPVQHGDQQKRAGAFAQYFDLLLRSSMLILHHYLHQDQGGQLLPIDNHKPVTLGKIVWHFSQLLLRYKDSEQGQGNPLCFPTSLLQQAGGHIFAFAIDKGLKYRNLMCHRGFANEDRFYAQMLQNLEIIVRTLEIQLQPFIYSFRFVVVEESDVVGGRCTVHGITLHGARAGHYRKSYTTNLSPLDMPITGHVYMIRQDEWYDMHPHIQYKECPSCRQKTIMIYDGGHHTFDVARGCRV